MNGYINFRKKVISYELRRKQQEIPVKTVFHLLGNSFLHSVSFCSFMKKRELILIKSYSDKIASEAYGKKTTMCLRWTFSERVYSWVSDGDPTHTLQHPSVVTAGAMILLRSCDSSSSALFSVIKKACL